MDINSLKIVENSESKNTKYYNQQHIEKITHKLLEYYADKDKKDRKNKGLCKYCYYYSNERFGGSAITLKECECCGLELSFSNTCVDKYCTDCAKRDGFCKHCGQKID